MLPTLVLLLCVAPTQEPPGGQDPAETARAAGQEVPDEEKEEEEKEGRSVAELNHAVRSAQRKLRRAELGVRVAELKSEEEFAKAELALEDEHRDLAAAEAELKMHESFDGPAAVREAELGMERAQSRLESARKDLEGILRIYEEEQEARSKDEIIRRHEMAVHFAERELAAAEAKLERTSTLAVGVEREKKAWAVEKAEREVRLAKRALERARVAGELAQLEARDEVQDAREKLQLAEGKLARARAKAEAGR